MECLSEHKSNAYYETLKKQYNILKHSRYINMYNNPIDRKGDYSRKLKSDGKAIIKNLKILLEQSNIGILLLQLNYYQNSTGKHSSAITIVEKKESIEIGYFDPNGKISIECNIDVYLVKLFDYIKGILSEQVNKQIKFKQIMKHNINKAGFCDLYTLIYSTLRLNNHSDTKITTYLRTLSNNLKTLKRIQSNIIKKNVDNIVKQSFLL